MAKQPCGRPSGGVWLVVLLALPGPAAAQALPAGIPVPLIVCEGRCDCVLPTGRADSEYYLVLGCLARGPGPYRVQVRTEPAADPVSVPVAAPEVDEGWQRRIRELADRLKQARRHPPAPFTYPPTDPPAHRTFYLFTGDGSLEDAADYAAVRADLQWVGRHCQVYLDRAEPDPAALRPTVSDVVRTFDEEVYPRAARDLGQALDVDRDGRFTILLTGWLGRLQKGRVALDGFVRSSDLYPDLPAPYGNRCDMMFLNANLRPGPHLRTVLAHEYTHAVLSSEHLFGDYLPDRPRLDEEGWLSEGLAHVVEALHGYGWSNLDHRVSAFLSAPERYPLVVRDYYGSGLWRDPGCRGATFLFLRWCVQRHGTGLAGRLVRTNLRGVENLETATQEQFEELFRQWSVALLLAGANLVPADGPAFGPRLDLRRPLGGRVLAGPRFTEVSLAADEREVRIAGTSAAYMLLHSPAGTRTRVRITAESGALLQVSVVRLPDETARLTLRPEPGDRPGTVRLRLTAHDTVVTLDEAAWELVVPRAGEATDGKDGADAWFGDRRLQPGDSRISEPLSLPGKGDDWVARVTATDAAGHRLAAWSDSTRLP